MAALIRQVALISITDVIPVATVMQISAALQKQASRDLGPIWDVTATVDPFDSLGSVPVGTWPIVIGGDVPPGAAGYHTDKNGQPISLVRASQDVNVLCQTCSHEMIEMLVDPFGSRFVAGDSPMPDQGRVNFLVEACDPSEAPEFGYTVNNLLVSDFYTPQYFDPVQSAGVRYSFTGAITQPRQVLQSGYLSWQDPVSKHYFQERRIETAEPDFKDLGIPRNNGMTPREFVDRATDIFVQSVLKKGRSVALMASNLSPEPLERAMISQASGWQELLDEFLEAAQDLKESRPDAAFRRAAGRGPAH